MDMFPGEWGGGGGLEFSLPGCVSMLLENRSFNIERCSKGFILCTSRVQRPVHPAIYSWVTHFINLFKSWEYHAHTGQWVHRFEKLCTRPFIHGLLTL